MRALLFAALIVALCTANAAATEPDSAEQRLLAIRILEGDRTLLETQLAVIVGFEAHASNVVPGSRQSDFPFELPAIPGCYVKVTAEGAPNLVLDNPPGWFTPQADEQNSANMIRCGGMVFEVTAPAGSRFEVRVCEALSVGTKGGNAVFSGRVGRQPDVISSISVQLQ